MGLTRLEQRMGVKMDAAGLLGKIALLVPVARLPGSRRRCVGTTSDE